MGKDAEKFKYPRKEKRKEKVNITREVKVNE